MRLYTGFIQGVPVPSQCTGVRGSWGILVFVIVKLSEFTQNYGNGIRSWIPELYYTEMHNYGYKCHSLHGDVS